MSVGTILSIICGDFAEQVKKWHYFSINAPLVLGSIVETSQSHFSNDIVSKMDLELKERIIRFILNDNHIYDSNFRCIPN
jgi:hypothetical protein